MGVVLLGVSVGVLLMLEFYTQRPVRRRVRQFMRYWRREDKVHWTWKRGESIDTGKPSPNTEEDASR